MREKATAPDFLRGDLLAINGTGLQASRARERRSRKRARTEKTEYDTEPSKKVLGVVYRTCWETLSHTGSSLVVHGALKRTVHGQV